MVSLTTVVLVVLVLVLLGGGWYWQSRGPLPPDAPRPAYYPFAAWSPGILLLVVLLVLYLTGHLR